MKYVKNHAQRGSAHVLVFSFVVLVIICAVGFLFWNNVLKSPGEMVDKSGGITSTPKQIAKLKLTDWKIQFNIPDGLTDTEVEYVKHTNNGGELYSFSTARIQALGGACVKQDGRPHIVPDAIYRLTTVPSLKPTSMLLNEEPIDGHYFVLAAGEIACSSWPTEKTKRQPVSPIETKDRAYLKEMFLTIKPL